MLQAEDLMPDPSAKLSVELLDDHALERSKALRHHYQLTGPRRLGLPPSINPQTMAQLRGKGDDATTLWQGLGKREGGAGPAERPGGGREGGKGTSSAGGGAGGGLSPLEEGRRRAAAAAAASTEAAGAGAGAGAGEEEIGCGKSGVGGGRRRSLPQP